MKSELLSRVYSEKWLRFFWALVLVMIPVTSFRFFPGGGGTIWRPLAIYPTLILAGLLFLRWMFEKKVFLPSPYILILFIFVAVVVLSSVINMIYPTYAYLGQTYFDRVLRGFVSLGFGMLFFFIGLQMMQSEEDLHFTLKWIFAAFVLSIFVAGLQWIALYTPYIKRGIYNQYHELFMIKGLRIKRIIGLAYEPGWFADQLVLYFIPWFGIAMLTGKRVLKKWWLDFLFLGTGLVVLLYTYSRSGIFSFAIVIGLFFLVYAPCYIKNAWQWFVLLDKNREKKWIDTILRLFIILIVVAIVFFVLYVAQSSNFFSRLWTIELDDGLYNYLMKNSMSARFVYSLMGGRVYAEHPIFGVGFGALGFHMPQEFPVGLLDNQTEMSQFLSGGQFRFLNAKNMYVRLLAETGLVGFVVFITFLLSLVAGVWALRKDERQHVRYVAGVSFLFVFGILIRFITFDSFSSPTIWVTLGMIISLMSTVKDWKIKEGGKLNE